MIILETTEGAKCGGYTSKNWDGSYKYCESSPDNDAFVFNMTQRYNCNKTTHAIDPPPNGFIFGKCILSVTSDTTLNQQDRGYCNTGKSWNYDIEEGVYPLTN